MADEYQRPTVADTDDQGNEVPTPATAPDAAPKTPEAKPGGITLLFKDAAGGEVSFKLKATTKLKKAMDAYAARVERDRHSLRFLFEGERVQDDSSAESMGMEDNDSVDVHTEQIGGGETRMQ